MRSDFRPNLLLFLALLAAPVGAQLKDQATTTRPSLEKVADFTGPMPTGVTVSSKGRIFVNFPRWGDAVDFTVAEVKDGKAVAYPDQEMNAFDPSKAGTTLLSVQSVVVDGADRLWALDTANPKFEGVIAGGAKLVGFDLGRNAVWKTILIPPDVALPTTYLNDVRFDLRRGTEGMAFITDSAIDGPNAIIVVDLANGRSWRKLHDHESTKAETEFLPFVEREPLMNREPGKPPSHLAIGADGIAISADGSRLFYCPLASRRLYSVAVDALIDAQTPAADVAKTVVDHGEKGASDGLESDAAGWLYATNYEHDAVMRRNGDEPWTILVQDPRMLWPDTLAVASDGHLYVIANQLHRQARFHGGADLRKKPYHLFRVRIDAKPVRLLPK